MYTLNTNTVHSTEQTNDHWLKFKTLTKETLYASELSDICQKFQNENRWVLVINPDEEPLMALSSNENIDGSKLLRVDSQGKTIPLESIQKTLARGNCAAVVVCNNQLANEHITELKNYAKQGKTHCIILNTPRQLH